MKKRRTPAPQATPAPVPVRAATPIKKIDHGQRTNRAGMPMRDWAPTIRCSSGVVFSQSYRKDPPGPRFRELFA